MIAQTNIEDVRPGDEVWDQHKQEWATVLRTYEATPVHIELDIGSGCISAEPGHTMFVRIREEYYVHVSGGGICGPFLSEIQAEEYITNIQDTVSINLIGELTCIKLVSPEQFLRDMVDLAMEEADV